VNKFCECGCGSQTSKPGNRFINGHNGRRESSWNKGISPSEETKLKISNSRKGIPSHKKGKTYEELYGEERAVEIKSKSSDSHIGQISTKKGKTHVEFYGEEKAKEISDKISNTLEGYSSPRKGQCFVTQYGPEKAEELRLKISIQTTLNTPRGEDHPQWKNGSSVDVYCPLWGSRYLKESIKIRDNYECQNPSCRKNTKVLCTHHIDYYKMNCDPNNLITLCMSCNGRANFNRPYWQEQYINIIQTINGD